MTGVGASFCRAAAGSLPAICWQTVPSEYATPPCFAQRAPERQTAGSGAVDTAARGPDRADGAHLNDKAAAEATAGAATALWVVAGAGDGAGFCATGRNRRRGRFTAFQHAGGRGRWSPQKPLLFTGAPVLLSLCNVSLLIDALRLLAGEGSAGDETPHATVKIDGREGRRSVSATVVHAVPGPESEPSGATIMGSIRTLVLFEVFRRSAEARDSEIILVVTVRTAIVNADYDHTAVRRW